MNYGTFLKKIRKSRKITQENLCKGIISRRTLCNLENNKSLISFDTLCKLLERLNIGFDEFLVDLEIKNNTLTYDLSLDKKLDNKQFQNKLRKYWENYLEKNSINDKIHAWVMILSNTKFSYIAYNDLNDMISEIKNYLFKIEDWKRIEILLFLNCLSYLDESQIQTYEEEVYGKVSQNSCYEYELSMFFIKRGLNIFENKIENNMNLFLGRFYDFTIKYPCKMYERVYYVFFNSLHSFSSGNIDRIKAHLAINSFASIGLYQEANELLDIFHNY
ncbi:MAG: helix-turn-helix domain-containing protein [Streptococcaceae bacterium]|jgi:transcriptional regulator with XRE-family HTH domain|nr:helix-turn-helix domain-containing protein [Streptococcaceae bacterium]